MGEFLDFPGRALVCLAGRLLIPTDSEEVLHCRVPGTISSSKSSMSSDMMKCWGVALPPMKVGSRLREEARDGRPGLLTMVKPVSSSICCQRLSLSRRAAVTSPRACLSKKRLLTHCDSGQLSTKTGVTRLEHIRNEAFLTTRSKTTISSLFISLVLLYSDSKLQTNSSDYYVWLTWRLVFCGPHHPRNYCEPHGRSQTECCAFSLSSLPGKTKHLPVAMTRLRSFN